MNGSKKTKGRSWRLQRYAWLLALAWTSVVAASLIWNVLQTRQNTLEAARIQARAAFEKDVLYRRWNAQHGGVYAPVTDETLPNPYLPDTLERDITTSSGISLTLINPAYMTRQVHELAVAEFEVYGHITSLNPIRPANAPDPWEVKALQAFERGETEVSALQTLQGQTYMRLMRPLITEEDCLKCHAEQGYVEGDVRGGISVSIPLSPLLAVTRSHLLALSAGHVLLWLIGLGGIFVGARRLMRSEQAYQQAAKTLRASKTRYQELLEQTQTTLTETQALYHTSRALIAVQDLPDLLQTVVDSVAEALEADRVLLATLDLEKRRVIQRVKGGPGTDLILHVSFDKLWEGLSGWALREAKPALSPKGVPDPRESVAVRRRRVETNCGAIIVVPLRYRQEVLGTLTAINRPDERDFTQRDVDLLAAIANQVTIAIENTRLYEETRRQAEEMTALYHTALEIGSPTDLSDLLWTICDRAAKLMSVAKGGLYLYDEARQELELVVSYKLEQDFTGTRIKLGEGVAGHVARTGQPLIVDDYSRWEGRARVYEGEPFVSVLGVPLKWQERVIGAISLSEERVKRSFTPDDERLLSLFAQQAAVAIESARLLQSEREQLHLAQTLQEVGALLTTRMSLQEVFERIFDLLAQVIPYDSVSIQLLNQEGSIDLVAGRGFPDIDRAKQAARIVASQTLEERFGEQRVVVIPDTYADPRWVPGMGAEYIRSWIGASLRVRGTLVGILNVDSATTNAYDTAMGETVAAFANQAAVAIENTRMFTQLRQAEAELAALIAELETRNAELERFVYTVSHDLQSPLITIRGFLGFLEKDALAGNTERMKSDIDRIVGATDKMHELLTELLELSRIGRLLNPPEQAPLADLAREAIEMVSGRLAQRGVEVTIAPDLPMVRGDLPRLREVLENLLDNAAKYMGDQPDPRIEVGVRHEGGETIFYVRDNGIGIDPAYHERVFDLFEKLDPASEGTGVGLAIVKRIVELHGGRIWVESEGTGKGSAFCFTLDRVID